MPRNSTQQSSSHSQQSERNVFDYSDMSFIVYESTSSGRQNTATFGSKSQAFDFVERFCDESSTVYIYKTKCIKAFSPFSSTSDTSSHNLSMLIDAAESVEQQTSSTQVPLFDGLEYTGYGKGYMLYPSRDTPFYGEKYLLDGWWNETQQGWFFRSQHVHQLEDNGATFVTKRSHISSRLTRRSAATNGISSSSNSSSSSVNLTGLTFSEYGKGYILYPRSNTSFYGEKYLLDGWWNETQQGWFFKREFYSQLVSHGAIYDTTVVIVGDQSENNTNTNNSRIGPSPFEIERDLSGFTIEPYGRGVILSCSRQNKFYKQKAPYLLGNLGWWNNAERGWFFQNQYVSELERLGATRIKQEPTSPSSRSSCGRSSYRSPSKSSRSTRSNTYAVDYVCADSQFC